LLGHSDANSYPWVLEGVLRAFKGFWVEEVWGCVCGVLWTRIWGLFGRVRSWVRLGSHALAFEFIFPLYFVSKVT